MEANGVFYGRYMSLRIKQVNIRWDKQTYRHIVDLCTSILKLLQATFVNLSDTGAVDMLVQHTKRQR